MVVGPRLNRRRLRSLLALYKNHKRLPDAQINQNTWCLIDRSHVTMSLAQAGRMGPGCGTVACSAGHAVIMFGPGSWRIWRVVLNTEFLEEVQHETISVFTRYVRWLVADVDAGIEHMGMIVFYVVAIGLNVAVFMVESNVGRWSPYLRLW